MRLTWIGAVLVGMVLVAPATAQHGHPLVGSWSGDWGPTAAQRNRVLLALEYDGERLTGFINPGRNTVTLSRVDLDPSNWTVTMDGAAADGTRRTAITGRIENLGSETARTLVGTWRQDGVEGDFRVVLN
jgi:hypothetical protein